MPAPQDTAGCPRSSDHQAPGRVRELIWLLTYLFPFDVGSRYARFPVGVAALGRLVRFLARPDRPAIIGRFRASPVDSGGVECPYWMANGAAREQKDENENQNVCEFGHFIFSA